MRRFRLSPFFIIIMTMFILSSLWPLLMGKNQEKIELTKAGELLDAGKVKVATISGDKLTLTDKEDKVYGAILPATLQADFYNKHIGPQVDAKNTVFDAHSVQESGLLASVVPYIIMMVGFIFIFNLILLFIVPKLKPLIESDELLMFLSIKY